MNRDWIAWSLNSAGAESVTFDSGPEGPVVTAVDNGEIVGARYTNDREVVVALTRRIKQGRERSLLIEADESGKLDVAAYDAAKAELEPDRLKMNAGDYFDALKAAYKRAAKQKELAPE
jgi:hypothetical protein